MNFQTEKESIENSVSYLQNKLTETPEVAVILGSGLGDFADLLSDKMEIDNSQIPNYPVSTVVGHSGKIIFGRLKNSNRTSQLLCIFKGRTHLYESGNLFKTTYPIEVASKLGIKKLIITNAAGGINKNFKPGDLMLINDFINLTLENPLIGTSNLKKISNNYFSLGLINRAKEVSNKFNIPLKEGVYCWTKGPTYETAAEIKMMGILGADAVGMSTIPEVLKSFKLGIEVLGISCITNLGTGISKTKLSHSEVTVAANLVKENFSKLITEIIFALN